MAVPKRKTTKSRAGKRRSHIKFVKKNIVEDKKSGAVRETSHAPNFRCSLERSFS